MLDRSRSAELVAVLEWYREMGVDQTVEDQPVDWLARGDAPPGADLQPVAAPEIRKPAA